MNRTLGTEKYSLSLRGKQPEMPMKDYLNMAFPDYVSNCENGFGFAEKLKVYGGRLYYVSNVTDDDISWFYDNGISFGLPLTGDYFTKADFEDTRSVLSKYHRPGNYVIATRYDYAFWIRANFPLYTISASAIKNVHSLESIKEVLKIYDRVCLPSMCNDDLAMLEAIPDKSRIVLFANAFCAYSCPMKSCYSVVSQFNYGVQDLNIKNICSSRKNRKSLSVMTSFDINKFSSMGFSHFKLLV